MTEVIRLEAGEQFLGRTGPLTDKLSFTLACDTSILADGDVICTTLELAGAYRTAGGRMLLQDLILIDQDDQGTAVDLVFFSATNSLGTVNGAPNISDANALDLLGHVSIAAADLLDYGGVRVATFRNIGLMLEDTGGTSSLFMQAIVRSGTPTYTAAGLKGRLGLIKY